MITPLTHGTSETHSTSETAPGGGLQGQDSASASHFALARASISNASVSQATQARPDPQAVPDPVVGSTRQEKTARDGARENSDPGPVLLGMLGQADYDINYMISKILERMPNASKTAALSPRLLDNNTGLFVFAHGLPNEQIMHVLTNKSSHENSSWTQNLLIMNRNINENRLFGSVEMANYYSSEDNFMSMKIRYDYIGRIIKENAEAKFGGGGTGYIALMVCYGKNHGPEVAKESGMPVVAAEGKIGTDRAGRFHVYVVQTDEGAAARLWIFYPDGRRKPINMDVDDEYIEGDKLDRIIRANL
jgi:hypothetical protein